MPPAPAFPEHLPDNRPAPPAPPLRLAMLLSGSGTTLANLIDRMADGRLRDAQIVLVISSRQNVRGVDIAQSAGLPVQVLRPRDFPGPDEFSAAISGALDLARADLVLMGGFLAFWHVPDRYLGRTLNIHPALLPRFGGRGFYGEHVHAAVLAAGETTSGCTVHLVDNEYDHGPVIAQAQVPVLPGDTPHTLAERVQAAERELYPRVIQDVVRYGVDWLARTARGA